jgi:hypothetical protein
VLVIEDLRYRKRCYQSSLHPFRVRWCVGRTQGCASLPLGTLLASPSGLLNALKGEQEARSMRHEHWFRVLTNAPTEGRAEDKGRFESCG